MVPTEVETAAGSKPGGAEEFKGQLLFLPWSFLFVSLSLSLCSTLPFKRMFSVLQELSLAAR